MLAFKMQIKKIIRHQKGQAMVEAAFALPIVFLLFAGCLQLIQIGIGTIVVKVAVYEAARQAHVDKQNLDQGQKVAAEICKTLSKGSTTFTMENENYQVVHKLNAIVPVLKNITITQTVPKYLFHAGDGM